MERIDRALRAEIAAGRLPGAVIRVVQDGVTRHAAALGLGDPADRRAMAADSLFRIYSMTKPFVSVAALILMEEGRLQLADPVAAALPAFAAARVLRADGSLVDAARPIRVYDLLTHTSGLTYGARSPRAEIRAAYRDLPVNPRDMAPDRFIAHLARAPLLHQPGTAWEYGFSTDLLGLVIERITGMALGAFLHERLFAPLGMRDTAFHVRPEDISRLARPFPADPLSGAALLDPDQTFDAAVPPRLHSGGAGALSSAPDYVRFARMLLEGGTLDGVRILSPASIRLMTADHLGTRVATPVAVGEAALQSPGYGFGLGLAVRLADGLASVPGSKGDCFWSGTAGTTFWIDKTARLAVVFMAQAPGEMRLRLRRLVRQLVYAALD